MATRHAGDGDGAYRGQDSIPYRGGHLAGQAVREVAACVAHLTGQGQAQGLQAAQVPITCRTQHGIAEVCIAIRALHCVRKKPGACGPRGPAHARGTHLQFSHVKPGGGLGTCSLGSTTSRRLELCSKKQDEKRLLGSWNSHASHTHMHALNNHYAEAMMYAERVRRGRLGCPKSFLPREQPPEPSAAVTAAGAPHGLALRPWSA